MTPSETMATVPQRAEREKSQEPQGEASDLNSEKNEEEPKKPHSQILSEEIEEGVRVFRRPTLGLFLSALSAGLDIGFSVFLMAVMHTALEGELPGAVTKLLMANMYAIGFLFVVLGRSELFTEQTSLAVLPVLSRRVPMSALGRVWGVIYVGNLVGTTIFAALVVWIAHVTGPEDEVIKLSALDAIARPGVNHTSVYIVLSGVLAGWLMGLLSWLVTASRDTISQVVIVWLITTAIGFAGLHHVVVGSCKVMAGILAGGGLTMADYGHFLLWATMGNAVGGGVFVALLKFSHGKSSEPEAEASK